MPLNAAKKSRMKHAQSENLLKIQINQIMRNQEIDQKMKAKLIRQLILHAANDDNSDTYDTSSDSENDSLSKLQ